MKMGVASSRVPKRSYGYLNGTTNGPAEEYPAKIKVPKGISYGLGNVEVYRMKTPPGFVPPITRFHTL